MVGVILVLCTIPLFASILRAPFAVVGPVIIVVCLIGAYTISGKMFDVYLALGFGILGYLFKKLDYPIAPLIFSMVLGDKAEDAFRQSMLMSGRVSFGVRRQRPRWDDHGFGPWLTPAGFVSTLRQRRNVTH